MWSQAGPRPEARMVPSRRAMSAFVEVWPPSMARMRFRVMGAPFEPVSWFHQGNAGRVAGEQARVCFIAAGDVLAGEHRHVTAAFGEALRCRDDQLVQECRPKDRGCGPDCGSGIVDVLQGIADR